jgi:hypothetical protein
MIQWTDSSWAGDYVDDLVDRYWEDNPNPRKKHNTQSKKMTRLQVGDLVRKKYGTRTIEVLNEYGYYFYGRYLHSGASSGRINIGDVVLLDERKTETEQGYGKMKGKLFQTKDGLFGIGLAVNSKGEYVLEMKGTNDLVAYAKKDVELVMPFTFSVQFNGTGTEYSYLGKEGSVKIGDLLLKTDSKGITVAKVTAVDTKSEKATKYFDGVKIVTEAIEN